MTNTMNALERAHGYAAIFINVGERWPDYVPVDATREGDNVYLQGLHMERIEDGWRITTNGEGWTVRPKADKS